MVIVQRMSNFGVEVRHFVDYEATLVVPELDVMLASVPKIKT